MVVSGCFFSFSFDAYFIVVFSDYKQGQLSDGRHVLWAVIFLELAGIFAKAHIQVPVQFVFYCPVPSYKVGVYFRLLAFEAADIETGAGLLALFYPAGSLHHDHALQSGPLLGSFEQI